MKRQLLIHLTMSLTHQHKANTRQQSLEHFNLSSESLPKKLRVSLKPPSVSVPKNRHLDRSRASRRAVVVACFLVVIR
jgi:hypothetical protein